MNRKKIKNKQYRRDIFISVLYIRIEARYPSGFGYTKFRARNFINAVMKDRSFSIEKHDILTMPYSRLLKEYRMYIY